MLGYLDKIYFNKPISYQSNIAGIILIVTGILYFYNPTPLNTKIGIASIIIGIFMISLITGKPTHLKISDTQLAIIIIAWVFFIFVLTVLEYLSIELFIIIIFIGMLIIKELLSDYTTMYIKKRMNIFIFLFIIAFIFIIVKKILEIIGN